MQRLHDRDEHRRLVPRDDRPRIVTSFRAELAAGTTAKLRVFRRDDGSTLTPIGTITSNPFLGASNWTAKRVGR